MSPAVDTGNLTTMASRTSGKGSQGAAGTAKPRAGRTTGAAKKAAPAKKSAAKKSAPAKKAPAKKAATKKAAAPKPHRPPRGACTGSRALSGSASHTRWGRCSAA